MSAPNPGTIRFKEIASSPAAPPVGYAIIYVKADNVLYLKDSGGVEFALGSASSITQLTGDVTATGPGVTAATVAFVGGQSAASVAAAVVSVMAATSANTFNKLVQRDAFGNFSATLITANLNGNAATATSATTTIDFTGTLDGDVSGTQSATVVDFVGGKTSSEVATSVDDTQAATSANTSSKIIKRDAFGNFSAGTMTGTASLNELLANKATDFSVIDNIKYPSTQAVSDLTDTIVGQGGGFNTAKYKATTTNQSATDPGAGKLKWNNATLISSTQIYIDNITDGGVDISNFLAKVGNNTVLYLQKIKDANIYQRWNIDSLVDNTGWYTLNVSLLDSLGVPFSNNENLIIAIGTVAGAALVGDITTIQPDDAASAGTASNFSRGDHKHAIVATAPTTTLDPTTANAEGIATSFARGDHTHAIATGLTADITTIQPDDSAAAGTVDKYARADHKHAIVADAAASQTPDQSNAEGSSTSFARADHVHNIPSGTPVQIGTTNNAGAAASFAKSDHVHNHGNQTNDALHALVVAGVSHGFMSKTDKSKIDAELPTSLGTANQVLGVNAGATAGEYKSVVGTSNQVSVTHAVGSITLATPQDIHTGATPTFAGENLTDRLELTEQSAPSTPAANKLRLYTEDSNGFTRIRSIDDTGTILTVNRDIIFMVKNSTGSTISKGKVVYVNGSDSTNGVVTVALAKADSSTTVPGFGLALEDITNGSFGRVLSTGILSNIDTSAFSDGQRVYLSATTAGALTATKPSSPANIWQRIGIVIKSHATTGSIEVRPLATHGEESGTNTGYTLKTVALIDGANIATDASLGNIFTVTLGGNRNLSAPTNPTDGQKITYRVKQDGTGSRGLTFDAIFNFGSLVPAFTPTTTASKTDYIGCIYNSDLTKWDVVAIAKGF